MDTTLSPPTLVKPQLRGVMHQISFFIALAAGAWLLTHASGAMFWACVVYLVSLCGQFADREGLRLQFIAADDLGPVPHDVGLCVYRIVQEALRNVVSHAGVPDVSVSLRRAGEQLELSISDRGRGFEPSAAFARGGLGLPSVDERVRLVGGALTITSAPGRGTLLDVRIPVGAADRAPVTAPA